MNAPDAATWWLATVPDVATDRAVVDDDACADPVVAGADDAVVADEPGAEDSGAEVTGTAATVDTVVVEGPAALAPMRADEPDEQAVPTRASVTSRARARSFIAPHLTAPL
jgi:hypothetical protein